MRESREMPGPGREARDHCSGYALTSHTWRMQDPTFSSTVSGASQMHSAVPEVESPARMLKVEVDSTAVCNTREGNMRARFLPRPAWLPEVKDRRPLRSHSQGL